MAEAAKGASADPFDNLERFEAEFERERGLSTRRRAGAERRVFEGGLKRGP